MQEMWVDGQLTANEPDLVLCLRHMPEKKKEKNDRPSVPDLCCQKDDQLFYFVFDLSKEFLMRHNL